MAMSVAEARALLQGCGARPLAGSPEDIRIKAERQCAAAARRQGWRGEWTPTAADEEYIAAQVCWAEARQRRYLVVNTLGKSADLVGHLVSSHRTVEAAWRARRRRLDRLTVTDPGAWLPLEIVAGRAGQGRSVHRSEVRPLTDDEQEVLDLVRHRL